MGIKSDPAECIIEKESDRQIQVLLDELDSEIERLDRVLMALTDRLVDVTTKAEDVKAQTPSVYSTKVGQRIGDAVTSIQEHIGHILDLERRVQL